MDDLHLVTSHFVNRVPRLANACLMLAMRRNLTPRLVNLCNNQRTRGLSSRCSSEMPRGMGLILFAAAALAVAVCGPVEATVAPAAVRVIAEVDQEAVVQLQGRAADSEIEDHSEFSIRRAVDGSCMHFNKADKLLVKLCGEQTLGDGEAGSDLITEVNTLRDQVAELKAEVASLKASQGTQQRSGRIGYWKFDAESCNQANIEDQSGVRCVVHVCAGARARLSVEFSQLTRLDAAAVRQPPPSRWRQPLHSARHRRRRVANCEL